MLLLCIFAVVDFYTVSHTSSSAVAERPRDSTAVIFVGVSRLLSRSRSRQGRAVTFFRWSGQIYSRPVSSFPRSPCTNNYWNRLIFDRAISKIKRVTLFGTQCRSPFCVITCRSYNLLKTVCVLVHRVYVREFEKFLITNFVCLTSPACAWNSRSSRVLLRHQPRSTGVRDRHVLPGSQSCRRAAYFEVMTGSLWLSLQQLAQRLIDRRQRVKMNAVVVVVIQLQFTFKFRRRRPWTRNAPHWPRHTHPVSSCVWPWHGRSLEPTGRRGFRGSRIPIRRAAIRARWARQQPSAATTNKIDLSVMDVLSIMTGTRLYGEMPP